MRLSELFQKGNFGPAMAQVSPLLLGLAHGMRQGQPYAGAQLGLAQMMQRSDMMQEQQEKQRANAMLSQFFAAPQQTSGNVTGGVSRYAQPVATPSPGLPGVGAALDATDPRFAAAPEFLHRIMMAESGGDPLAVSSKGAVGTMQTMPGTLTDPGFGVRPATDPTNPAEQSRVGRDYYNAMLNRYKGDRVRALVAYNWGPGNADKWDGRMESLPSETQGYIRRIMGGGEGRARGIDPARAVQILQSPHVSSEVKQMIMAQMQGGGDKGTALQQNVQWLRSQGMSFEDALKTARSGQTINVDTGAKSSIWGEPPKDHVWLRNPEGEVVTEPVEGGVRPVSVPIGGSKPAMDAEDAKTREGKASEQALFQADVVTETIDEIRNLTKRTGLFDLPETGIVGEKLGRWGLSQDAVDVRNKIAALESAVAFDRLQRMRESSPNGGALGAVSERELALLAADMGSLKQSSSKAEFDRVLARVERRYKDIMRKFSAYPELQGTLGSDPLGLF